MKKMRKKIIISFYDLLLYGIFLASIIVTIVILSVKSIIDWSWIFNPNFRATLRNANPIASIIVLFLFVRHFKVDYNTAEFYYFPFTTSWYKVSHNIDANWNQKIILSEIKDIEIVKLTKEEKRTKVFYKHWFNKYLKINLISGSTKYVYVGNYTNSQIQKIINLMTINSMNDIYMNKLKLNLDIITLLCFESGI